MNILNKIALWCKARELKISHFEAGSEHLQRNRGLPEGYISVDFSERFPNGILVMLPTSLAEGKSREEAAEREGFFLEYLTPEQLGEFNAIPLSEPWKIRGYLLDRPITSSASFRRFCEKYGEDFIVKPLLCTMTGCASDDFPNRYSTAQVIDPTIGATFDAGGYEAIRKSDADKFCKVYNEARSAWGKVTCRRNEPGATHRLPFREGEIDFIKGNVQTQRNND